jgi:sporulation protein YlmC with PRC-barrel domain
MALQTYHMLSASSIVGDKVRNLAGETLGKIEDVMLDHETGRVAYAVLSFGGFMGVGDKLFAVPWHAMTVDLEAHEFVLDVDEERLEKAPGFDKYDVPSAADSSFLGEVYAYYQISPWYEHL